MSRGSISIDIELYANVTAEPSDVKIQIFVGLWCIVWCRWSRRSTSCSLNSSSSTLLRLSLLGPTTTTTDTNINTNLASQPQHPIWHLFCIFTFLSFAQGGPICYKTPPFCSCKTISLQSEWVEPIQYPLYIKASFSSVSCSYHFLSTSFYDLFLTVQNSSIGELVKDSLTHSVSHSTFT